MCNKMLYLPVNAIWLRAVLLLSVGRIAFSFHPSNVAQKEPERKRHCSFFWPCLSDLYKFGDIYNLLMTT